MSSLDSKEKATVKQKPAKKKAGKIIDNIDEEHLKFINAAVEKVNECINVQFNRFLSQENQIILYNVIGYQKCTMTLTMTTTWAPSSALRTQY